MDLRSRRHRTLLITVVVVGLVGSLGLTVAGCGKDSTAAKAAVPASTHNDADVAFTQSMIAHHQEAIDMSGAVIIRGTTPQVRSLAQRIKAAQDPEMRLMTTWLQQWNIDPASLDQPMGNAGDDHSMATDSTIVDGAPGGAPTGSAAPPMSGMMTTPQQEEFDAASGVVLDRLFLELMIAHHTGAVSMAEEQIPAGANSEVTKLATDVKATQEREIKEMQILLANLPAN